MKAFKPEFLNPIVLCTNLTNSYKLYILLLNGEFPISPFWGHPGCEVAHLGSLRPPRQEPSGTTAGGHETSQWPAGATIHWIAAGQARERAKTRETLYSAAL